MRNLPLSVALAALLLNSVAIAGPHKNDDEVKAATHEVESCRAREICGLKNPEDVIRLGQTHWAIASRLALDPSSPGALYLVDLKARKARVLVPDISGPVDTGFKQCPSPPTPGQLVTHGLDVRWTSTDRGELLAVNHGGRQSIEVFDLRILKDGVKLKWKGCVVVPDDVLANAVAALPDGMAITSFGERDDKDSANLLSGRPSGFVATWSAGKGWARLAGSQFAGDNGITSTPDGKTLYINGWGDGTLHILPAHGDHARNIHVGDFHPDNIHRLSSGRLLIAGQVGSSREIMACSEGSKCHVGSEVVIVDPRNGAVFPQAIVQPTPDFAAASTALLYAHDFWASSFRGDRLELLGHPNVHIHSCTSRTASSKSRNREHDAERCPTRHSS